MTPAEQQAANAALKSQSPLDIVRWGLERSGGRAIVSTNFRPYEAVILHLVTQLQPDIPVLWVDHGYNRPATYRHAEALRARLKLNIKAYLPRKTAAHYDAVDGGFVHHLGQQELTDAALTARRRPLGDAWAWSRKSSSDSDISPLVAVTLAHWASRSAQAAEPMIVDPWSVV